MQEGSNDTGGGQEGMESATLNKWNEQVGQHTENNGNQVSGFKKGFTDTEKWEGVQKEF